MCLGGGGSKQTTNQEASIAPELSPVFKQTGEQIADLQNFSPWQYAMAGGTWPGFFGSAYGSQPYAQPPGAIAPGTPTPYLQGGMPPRPNIDDAPVPFLPRPNETNFSTNWTGGVPPDMRNLTGEMSAQATGSPTSGMTPEIASMISQLSIPQNRTPGMGNNLTGEMSATAPQSAAPQSAQTQHTSISDAAEAYWQANPDVKADPYFGSSPQAALEHFKKFGSQENRSWTGDMSQLLPGTPLDEFLFPHYQQIPGFTPGQQALSETQMNRAYSNPLTYQELAAQDLSGTFGDLRYPEASALSLSNKFGNLRFPEAAALGQINYVSGGPLGQAPATLAAMDAVRNPVLNDLALAGLGNSDAVASNLAGAFSPILAQEMATRAQVIPQLTSLGQNLRAGDISAADLQSQIGAALRAGDVQTANMLSQLGGTAATRESQLINEAFQTQEQQRAIMEGRGKAELNDFLRRQQLAQSLTTGILGGFPAVTGSTSTVKTKDSGGGMLGTVICTELHRQGFMDDETFAADQEFGSSLPLEVLRGYHFWGVPVVGAMRRSRLVTLIVAPFGLAAAREMRKRVDGGKGSVLGTMILDLGIPVCRFIGGILLRPIQVG